MKNIKLSLFSSLLLFVNTAFSSQWITGVDITHLKLIDPANMTAYISSYGSSTCNGFPTEDPLVKLWYLPATELPALSNVIIEDKDYYKALWVQLNTALALGRKVDLVVEQINGSGYCYLKGITMYDPV